MASEMVHRTNTEIMRIREGLAVLQQVYMMRAGQEPAAAQKAMDIARLHSQYLGLQDVYNRAREMLVAEYGEPNQRGQGFTVSFSEEYKSALESLADATQPAPGDVIELSASDLVALHARPDVLAAIYPVVKLV